MTGSAVFENPNPTIHNVPQTLPSDFSPSRSDIWDDEISDPYTPSEIYNLIRNINDPEHPLSLEQLNVVRLDHITVEAPEYLQKPSPKGNGSGYAPQILVKVFFTPTIPHCSMATLIGLCIRVKLWRSLPRTCIIQVMIQKGTHVQEAQINKQLGDKERVAAALENDKLREVVWQCMYGPARPGIAL